jgi:type IV pilus assembly protein PilQ
LQITPHVIDDRYLRMDILVEKDEVDFSREVDGNPVIIQKHTETSLIVENSETIVISGLSKNTGHTSDSGVPGLKDVPVLGWFFKGETKYDKMEDVLIFITPSILPKKSQMADTSGLSGYKNVDDLKKLTPTNNPKAVEWLEQSTLHLNQNDWPETLRLASIAVTLDPGLAEAYVNMGRSHYEQGQLQQAFENTVIALHLDADNARALNLKGLIMEATGRIAEAQQSFRKSCGLGYEPGCRNDKRLFYDTLSTVQ